MNIFKILMFNFILIFIFGIVEVNALTFTDTEVITDKGVSMSYDKYYELSKKYSDIAMDAYSYKYMSILASDNLVTLASSSLSVITDYVYDENGDIESITHYNFDDVNEFEKVWNNGNNDFVRGNVYNQIHSTDSKSVIISSNMYDDDELGVCYFIIEFKNIWRVTPKIKSYDVIAIRWINSNVSVFDAE